MEDARAYAANEWAELVREIGTARLDAQDAADGRGPRVVGGGTVMTDICVECGQVIVWVHEFALWAVGGDAHSGSGVRCAGALEEMHAPVVEVVR